MPVSWAFNPRLWFTQAESAFNSSRIRSDTSRYVLLVAHLPLEVTQKVANVIIAPPATDRYEALKTAVLQRLAQSSDHQLQQLLNEVQLGDRKPSQLLRHVKRLAGTAMSEDAMRIKWLDLLPPYASRMCRVLKATSLDELAALANFRARRSSGTSITQTDLARDVRCSRYAVGHVRVRAHSSTSHHDAEHHPTSADPQFGAGPAGQPEPTTA